MQEEINIQVNNKKIRGILENSKSDKLMILVPGFTGDMGGPDNIFEELSKKLQDKMFAVLRFNFRGTPPSDMDFQDMTVETETEDLKAVINYAKSKGYNQIGILGESMGGSIVATAIITAFKVVILWYPAFDFKDTSFKNYLTEESQRQLKDKGFILESGFKIGKQFVNDIPDVKLYQKVKEIKCPVLFLHGDKDSDVPYLQSQKAFQLASEQKKIHIIKGAEHCFKNEQEKVIDLTLQFLEQHF
ncbi:TPA: alpha/beta fold hydrolase [Candidatus Woesearchaeota archaeon]|nr:alpha/beta fold hydrolase [Candidatus Woesearchaeota archaeon]